jgi:dienelactone hydrolase
MFEFIKLIWILLIFFSVSSCSNKKVDPCTQTKTIYSSIDIEYDTKICFKSIDSYDLNYENKPEITIYANLSFPQIKKETYDAVILSHGSGGLRKYHNAYVELLNNNGYVVFQIDHYKARNIRYDKTFSKVSGITFMNDAYRALRLIKTHPKIEKVSYIGWSQGGVGPILSHFKPVTDFINQGQDIFDATIAIYPYCGFTFKKDTKTTNPLLMLTGKDDDLTPEKACINIYEKFLDKNENIKHISIAGARHGYDNPFLFFGFKFDHLPSLHVINDDCTLTISEDGGIISLSNKKVPGPKESAALLNECSTRGVYVKYSPYATERTFDEILRFLEDV